MNCLRSSIRPSPKALACLVAVALVFAATSAFAYTVRKDQSEYFYQSTPLTYTPGRSTPAVAETTIRHQVFFSDLESGSAGWSTFNWRAGQPNGWNIVTGAHACAGNSWWCGQTGLPHGDGYGNDWIQTLTTAVPITLTAGTNTKLLFKMRSQTELGYDWCWVLMKGANAGARWDTLASYSGDLGSTCSNQSISVPDSFTTVTQPVTLQFLFGSDMSVSAQDSTGAFSGWTLDDVQVKRGGTIFFTDDMESGASKWTASSPNPGLFWHLENSPTTSQPSTCFFLSTNVWVPFQGSGFGVVPDFTDQMLITPPMDITGVFSAATPTTSLRLQFDQWINLPIDNSVYWSLWIQGSDDKVTWTPWHNALFPLEFSGGNPQCLEGQTYNFDPYNTTRTGVAANTKYLRLGIRLKDEKAIDGCNCGGPLKIGATTEGMYIDNFGVYYIYTISGVENVGGVPLGARTQIRKAYPNPFNPSTTIEFSVSQSGSVRVGIFDIQGRQVATLVNEAMNAGIYRVRWNGKSSGGADVASGVYFVKVQSRGGSDTGRLALVK